MADQTQRETISPEMTTGLTEVTLLVAAISALLTIFFGHDFGISQIAQKAAPHLLTVVLATLAIYRLAKHAIFTHANTTVTKVAIAAAATEIKTVPMTSQDISVEAPESPLPPEPSDPSTDPPSMGGDI